MLNYSPTISAKYHIQFMEAASRVAFLPLSLQTQCLNEKVASLRTKQETARAESQKESYSELSRCIAALLLLRDLLRIGWQMTLSGPIIQLYKNAGGHSQTDVKLNIRESMSFERSESIQTSAVKDFVRYMERTRLVNDQPRSILSLMADGQKLSSLLMKSASCDKEKRFPVLSRSIKPFLQLVQGDEKDEFTDYKLFDIWRYFRLTWSTPYRSTPGRNLFYLIRDAAQPCHPIMGIAALANCVIGLKCRDDRIGWTPDAIADQTFHAKKRSDAEFRQFARETAALLEDHLKQGLASISIEGLTTSSSLAYPSREVIESLEALAADAAEERHVHLRQEALPSEQEFELAAPGTPLRGVLDRYERDSSKALFRRKRAAKLAKLLAAKMILQERHVFEDPATGLPALLWTDGEWRNESDSGRTALRNVLNANKESKVGTSMMEIIVCGAVQPYNHILGGKLVAMLLTSPQVVQDYQERYGEQVSEIASQVAGYEVTRPAHLVYLGTSSLYVSDADKVKYRKLIEDKKARAVPLSQTFKAGSSSQYNRIHLPASTLKGQGEIRYECIGMTEGFGVVHFSAETCQALEELDIILHGAKRVNSIFGEGTSPRMRKIRQGISLLGLDDSFLVHGQSRLVYGINLAHNTERYLAGKDTQPSYFFSQAQPKKATERIAQYWVKRWVASRVEHTPALEAVAQFVPQEAAVSRELLQAPQRERSPQIAALLD